MPTDSQRLIGTHRCSEDGQVYKVIAEVSGVPPLMRVRYGDGREVNYPLQQIINHPATLGDP
jgi:hypothetical protein